MPPDNAPGGSVPQRIHLFGASGSGTTTLGEAISNRLRILHLDTDDYYWKPTNPPFVEKNAPADRLRMIERDVSGIDSWVLSGSLCGWGDSLAARFTVAIFVRLDPALRMERLKARERDLYGRRIEFGGDMHQQHLDFMAWAESYDTAAAPIRSLDLHEKWLRQLSCPIIRIDSSRPTEALVKEFLNHAEMTTR